jgi:Rod binding domain-containing protein
VDAIAATSTTTGMGHTGTSQPRLVHAAHEFEAQMMKELLKPMTGVSSLSDEDQDAGESFGAGGALGEFASEALGRALSEQGGFGIARKILQDLSHSGNPYQSTPVTGEMHGNTVIKALK